MRIEQEKVAAFHDKYGYTVADRPSLLSPKDAAFRRMLIEEETRELFTANEVGDIAGVADGLADLLYVVLGTAVFHGIDIQPIFDEVHRSNMTKDLAKDGLNKPVKGPTFSPPRVAELVVIQSTGLEDLLR